MDIRTYEPELGELLDDSGVQALMRSDGIERHEVEALAETLRRSWFGDTTAGVAALG